MLYLEVEKIEGIEQVRWSGGEHLIHPLGKEMDARYTDMVKSLSIYPEIVASQHNLIDCLYAYPWLRHSVGAFGFKSIWLF